MQVIPLASSGARGTNNAVRVLIMLVRADNAGKSTDNAGKGTDNAGKSTDNAGKGTDNAVKSTEPLALAGGCIDHDISGDYVSKRRKRGV